MNGNGPVRWYPKDKLYADECRPAPDELNKMKAALLTELDKLI